MHCFRFLLYVVFCVQAYNSQLCFAKIIHVGPKAEFAKLSLAMKSTRDGDVVEINSAGNYAGDVCRIDASDLIIRGVGRGRAKFPAAGKSFGRKAIWVIRGKNVTVENIEFSGARVPDKNGAGIRAEGENLTVRNCKFHDCQTGLLGGKGAMLIEHCEFSHCGLDGQSHNLYIGQIDKLTFRFNYSHHAKVGHLLKSRARENYIYYNLLTDEEDGSSSYVINLPNGGASYLVGNVLCQGNRTSNSTLIAYGEEGNQPANSKLHLINNTLVNNRHTGVFIKVRRVPSDFVLVAKNNIFAGRGTVCNWPKAEMVANFSGGEPKFVNRNEFDFRLQKDSPCMNQGTVLSKEEVPRFQYVHPRNKMKRPSDEKIDIGAFEFLRNPVGAHPRAKQE